MTDMLGIQGTLLVLPWYLKLKCLCIIYLQIKYQHTKWCLSSDMFMEVFKLDQTVI